MRQQVWSGVRAFRWEPCRAWEVYRLESWKPLEWGFQLFSTVGGTGPPSLLTCGSELPGYRKQSVDTPGSGSGYVSASGPGDWLSSHQSRLSL